MFVVGWERGRGVWERLFLDSVKGMGLKKMVGELALKTFVAFLVLNARARVCNLKFWGCVCRWRRMFWRTVCWGKPWKTYFENRKEEKIFGVLLSVSLFSSRVVVVVSMRGNEQSCFNLGDCSGRLQDCNERLWACIQVVSSLSFLSLYASRTLDNEHQNFLLYCCWKWHVALQLGFMWKRRFFCQCVFFWWLSKSEAVSKSKLLNRREVWTPVTLVFGKLKSQ